jgi:hypothetical protein
MITALKPVYDFKTKTFNIEVRRNADPILVHAGYFVYDDAKRVLERMVEGQFLNNWKANKRQSIIDWLTNEAKSQP